MGPKSQPRLTDWNYENAVVHISHENVPVSVSSSSQLIIQHMHMAKL